MEFSEFCLETRLRLNLSQEKLAKKLGVSFATVNRWEKGKTQPQMLTLNRMKQFCEKNGIHFTVKLNP